MSKLCTTNIMILYQYVYSNDFILVFVLILSDYLQNVSSSAMPKLEPADTMTEDSMDGGPPSVSSSDLGERTLNTSIVMTTPSSSRKKNPNHKKLVTGYILYTSDVRKAVVQNNPDRSFGEVSRIVGNEVQIFYVTYVIILNFIFLNIILLL